MVTHDRGKATLLREFSAGITVACLALPLSISAGVLVYSTLGPEYAARGAIAGLLCAVAGGIAASIFGQSSFVTTIPTMAIALVQASSVGALVASWHGDASAVSSALPIMVLLVGIWQIVFATTGLSRIIKFTPHPVLAGFVTGIGALMMLQELPILAGEHSLRDFVGDIMTLRWPHPFIAIFGFGLVVAILVLERIFPRAPNLLIGLVLGFLAFHFALHMAPNLDLGATIGAISPSSVQFASLIDLNAVESLLSDFSTLKIVIFGSLTLALLGTLEGSFTLRAAQQLTDMPAAPRRDVMAQGIANLVSAFAGGVAVGTSIKLSAANYHAGGRSRASPIAAGLILLFATLLTPGIIFSLPVVVLAAILFIASLRLIDLWILQLLREAVAPEKEERVRARLNLLIVVAVLATTIFGEPVMGAAVGIGLSCLIFIAGMSRPIISQRFSGDRIRSKRVRCHSHVEILRRYGGNILILELQGVLFFGNASDLADELRELEKAVDIVILDMLRVSDVDTSGVAVLQQIARRFESKRKALVACSVNQKFSNIVRAALGKRDEVQFFDRDTALEWAEEKLVDAQAPVHEQLEIALEKADLTRQMRPEDIHVLAEHLQLMRYATGIPLCRVGDLADRLWILKRGSVSVRIAGEHSNRRLASLGPGCSVGEMGLLEKCPRSADVIADDDVEAYLLTQETFDTILREQPRLGQALLANIAQQLAHRLRDTSEELRSLTY